MDLDCLAMTKLKKKNLFTYKYQHEYQRHILQGRLFLPEAFQYLL